MENSKFEIRNSKGLNGGARGSWGNDSANKTARVPRAKPFELRISNFEFSIAQ
jgi:hypothetical protein